MRGTVPGAGAVRGRGWLSFTARDAAIDGTSAGEERTPQQRRPTRVAAEALLRRVPVLALVAHLACRHTRNSNFLSF